ncbi:MAG: protein TolA, partial [Candidatus Electrothrix sp. AS4_5]|nr:protein TolA [Candidatus Electrothrix gigas]
MNMEDEILEELATQERLIAYERAEKEKAEAEKRKAEEEKEKAEAEKARLEKLLKQAGIDF